MSNGENYPKLEKPEFRSNIPAHLLQGVDEQTKYVLDSLSITTQQNEWLVKAVQNSNSQILDMNMRIKKMEKLRDKLSGFWAVLMAIIVALTSIFGCIVAAIKVLRAFGLI